jgi:hypothetical protein
MRVPHNLAEGLLLMIRYWLSNTAVATRISDQYQWKWEEVAFWWVNKPGTFYSNGASGVAAGV